MNNLITLNKISKSFLTNRKILVLKKINYKFKKGKIYSLVGPSGSGKSTLLNILSLIDKPTVGSVKIDDKVVNYNDLSINDKIRAKRIGIIYQQNNLLPDFTALENVYLARLSIDDNKKKAVDNAKNIIQKMGLIKRIGEDFLLLGMAFIYKIKNKIILADEPTGSLDQSTAKEVFNILYKLKNSNRLIIYATHNRFFANMADCKLEMIDGNIKAINARIK